MYTFALKSLFSNVRIVSQKVYSCNASHEILLTHADARGNLDSSPAEHIGVIPALLVSVPWDVK